MNRNNNNNLVNVNNKKIFEDLLKLLNNMSDRSTSEKIQTEIYEIGKKHNFLNLRDYFKLIYQVLLGQEQGPRLGSFFKLFGIEKSISLIEDKLIKPNYFFLRYCIFCVLNLT